MRAKDHLYGHLQDAVRERGYHWPEKISIEVPKDKKFGDLATNLAMVLAKQAGQNPQQLARTLAEDLLNKDPALKSVETAGPGFLNFFFQPSFWQKTVLEIQARGQSYGALQLGEDKKILIEYVSANPTGPLHIGHGRGAAVGDSLARILRFTGHEVTTEYYLNDVGRQMNLLGKSIWLRYLEVLGREIEFPDELYKGQYIRDLALEIKESYESQLLQWPSQEALDFCLNFGKEKILSGIKKDLQNFRAEHQLWISEKNLVENNLVERMLNYLTERDLAFEQEGALWFRSTAFGDDKDRVLRKSDGQLTYFASDIAYHADKFARGFGKLIDVWGADHHGYVSRIKAAVQAMGRKSSDLEMVLIQLVNLMRRGRQVAMSTRAGEFETLADISQEIGVDAARFIFLSRKSDSPLDVDIELLKEQSMENPVYYVQYAHARICSMMHKARERGIQILSAEEELLASLNTEEDLELLKLLERFPETLENASANLSPHFVTYYLQELAGTLHRYYNKHQVLNVSNPVTMQGRIQLMLSVAQVIQNGLNLLGVSAPQKM